MGNVKVDRWANLNNLVEICFRFKILFSGTWVTKNNADDADNAEHDGQ